jgi:hypothetical protein
VRECRDRLWKEKKSRPGAAGTNFRHRYAMYRRRKLLPIAMGSRFPRPCALHGRCKIDPDAMGSSFTCSCGVFKRADGWKLERKSGPDVCGIDFSRATCDRQGLDSKNMEKLRGAHILERGKRFLMVWKRQAPEQESFAGIRYEELHAEVEEAREARERVLAVEAWLRGLRLERDKADRKLAIKLKRVACGVCAEPGYGDDCGFIRALGFVPHSEIRSGRPRKRKGNG